MTKIVLTLTIFLCLLVSSAFGQAPNLNDGLQAHFEFESNLLDETKNHYDLTNHNGKLNYRKSLKTGQASSYKGQCGLRSTKSYSNNTYKEIALSMWFKTSTVNKRRQVMFQGAYCGFSIQLEEHTGKIEGFVDGNSDGAGISSKRVTDGKWHHIVYQNDGARSGMYLDGILVTKLKEKFVKGTGTLYLGMTNRGIDQYTGLMDEVRIYNRVLTDDEIKLLSEKKPVEPEPNLVKVDAIKPINDVPATPKEATDATAAEFEISAFPNPTSGVFTVKSPAEGQLYIFNLSGTLIQSVNVNSSSSFINLSAQANGVYVVIYTQGEERKSLQIIKQ